MITRKTNRFAGPNPRNCKTKGLAIERIAKSIPEDYATVTAREEQLKKLQKRKALLLAAQIHQQKKDTSTSKKIAMLNTTDNMLDELADYIFGNPSKCLSR